MLRTCTPIRVLLTDWLALLLPPPLLLLLLQTSLSWARAALQ
jgi:hypothetical protein